MREILFRGKHTRTGEWVEGLIWKKKYNDSKFFISCFPERDDNEEVFAVLPETVGQGSTVLDKNGVEMYEGDIVYGAAHWLERFKPAVVTFRNGSFGLLWYRGDIEEFNPFTSLCNVEYEVVGNIYDNPELMDENGYPMPTHEIKRPPQSWCYVEEADNGEDK